MILLAVALAGIFAIAYPTRSPVHPGVMAFITGETMDTLECRQAPLANRSANQSANQSIGGEPPPRNIAPSLLGAYECHRPVFSADERDPYIGLILREESAKAKRVAAELAGGRIPNGVPSGVLWLHVEGEVGRDARESALIKNKIASIYRGEIAALLGAEKVARLDRGPQIAPLLSVQLERLDTPELISTVRLNSKIIGERP